MLVVDLAIVAGSVSLMVSAIGVVRLLIKFSSSFSLLEYRVRLLEQWITEDRLHCKTGE